MVIKLYCKYCRSKIAAEDDLIGKRVYCPACNGLITLPVPQFGVGQQLGGFEIEQWLGAGAMGEVYLAKQTSMNRKVALKVMKRDPRKNHDEELKRFLHEARVLAQLNHKHIVPAYDAGDMDGCHYLAMGYVHGVTVEERINRNGAMGEKESLGIILQVADALNFAWKEFKLLHRDLKPANIMLAQDGEVKLMDMGIAKGQDEDSGITQAGYVVGTPFYMSPEQAQGGDHMDFRSDIYALGCTLYHMVAGKLPFSGPNLMSVLSKKISGSAPDPRQYNPAISERVVRLLERMMAFDPQRRFVSYDALIVAIQTAHESAQDREVPSRPASGRNRAAVIRDSVPTEEVPRELSPWRRQKKLLGLTVGLGVLSILLIACLIIAGGKESDGPDVPEPVPLPTLSEALAAPDPALARRLCSEEGAARFVEAASMALPAKAPADLKAIGATDMSTLTFNGGHQSSVTAARQVYDGVVKKAALTVAVDFQMQDATGSGCLWMLSSAKNAHIALLQNKDILTLRWTADGKELEQKLGRLNGLRHRCILTFEGKDLLCYLNGRKVMDTKLDVFSRLDKWAQPVSMSIGGALLHDGKTKDPWRGSLQRLVILPMSLRPLLIAAEQP